ncbi:3-methyladenine DNA glycosylase [Lentilactobacillus kefiri]|uniref:Putative 3-methyladenine DNA glycosylase n=1 Tax=Lentilactobacillus kefiri TaxID=33962 RepID=A0A511DRG4_LENKE|nr:DNA-3-methyladenine glycosylase [Lentilactobacillus kefiri]MCP9368514.1 DNA-3-methyladenine glycosylase [Lentilactobacillus kefiri]MDM7492011.1 DNA-3-methyladenine glycosylase [Lentilactobacillus kefiri]PAK60193.1 3-methyladenine DNA glycosylase [Lentilactobacillus kefiri]PAK84179.1 3-methyladenine DNA glycosylase [Lentilactobacillus kefiri]PAL07509.1 3-methyladenine DNA glycosylase [Lentilactobacillus kefiri]
MDQDPFYSSSTTDQISREMLGMLLTYDSPKGLVGGWIVETEAYMGQKDSAAHAFKGRRTASNEPLYGPPGTVYIYSIHGRYLLDVAAQEKDIPQGVLIRAVEPTIGLDIMEQNRTKHGVDLTNGPGKLMEAFGIADKKMNMEIFGDSKLNIHQQDKKIPAHIEESNRIGVANQGTWATKPLRYFVKGNPYVSGIKKRDVDLKTHGWR